MSMDSGESSHPADEALLRLQQLVTRHRASLRQRVAEAERAGASPEDIAMVLRDGAVNPDDLPGTPDAEVVRDWWS